jgi:hypothetical protein
MTQPGLAITPSGVYILRTLDLPIRRQPSIDRKHAQNVAYRHTPGHFHDTTSFSVCPKDLVAATGPVHGSRVEIPDRPVLPTNRELRQKTAIYQTFQ